MIHQCYLCKTDSSKTGVEFFKVDVQGAEKEVCALCFPGYLNSPLREKSRSLPLVEPEDRTLPPLDG